MQKLGKKIKLDFKTQTGKERRKSHIMNNISLILNYIQKKCNRKKTI